MRTINDIYKSMLLDIYLNGEHVKPRGMLVKEIRNHQVTLENILDNRITVYGVKTLLKYAKTELGWYLSGSNRIDWHPLIEKIWKQYSDNGVHVNSAYGHRIFGKHTDFINQWNWVIDELAIDLDSRRAVININYSDDKLKETRDFPCTMYIQVFIRNKRLHWTVAMRSCDVYFGFRNDLYCFTSLQRIMANQLSLDYGSYTHFTGSLHMYEKEFPKIEHMMAEGTLNIYRDEILFGRVMNRRVFGKGEF